MHWLTRPFNAATPLTLISLLLIAAIVLSQVLGGMRAVWMDGDTRREVGIVNAELYSSAVRHWPYRRKMSEWTIRSDASVPLWVVLLGSVGLSLVAARRKARREAALKKLEKISN